MLLRDGERAGLVLKSVHEIGSMPNLELCQEIEEKHLAELKVEIDEYNAEWRKKYPHPDS